MKEGLLYVQSQARGQLIDFEQGVSLHMYARQVRRRRENGSKVVVWSTLLDTVICHQIILTNFRYGGAAGSFLLPVRFIDKPPKLQLACALGPCRQSGIAVFLLVERCFTDVDDGAKMTLMC